MNIHSLVLAVPVSICLSRVSDSEGEDTSTCQVSSPPSTLEFKNGSMWECAKRTKEHNVDLRKQETQPSPLPDSHKQNKISCSNTDYFLYFSDASVGSGSL